MSWRETRRLRSQAKELIRESERLEKTAGKSLAEEVHKSLKEKRGVLKQALAGESPEKIEEAGEALEKLYDEHLVRYRKSTIREYIEALAIALALALFIRHFFIQAFEIPSGSMRPTLLVGDYLLVNKAVYGFTVPFTLDKFWIWREPKREEVIVFAYPRDTEKDFIKRVIGLPGEEIEVRDGKIWIDGELYPDPYGHWNLDEKLPPANHLGFSPQVVPPGHLFVMGDNRDNSSDSRVWGYVPYRNIKGKALIIYFSKGPGLDFRWNRFFTLIH